MPTEYIFRKESLFVFCVKEYLSTRRLSNGMRAEFFNIKLDKNHITCGMLF